MYLPYNPLRLIYFWIKKYIKFYTDSITLLSHKISHRQTKSL